VNNSLFNVSLNESVDKPKLIQLFHSTLHGSSLVSSFQTRTIDFCLQYFIICLYKIHFVITLRQLPDNWVVE